MAATVFRRSHQLNTVEILDLRHFSSSDLRPLLDQEVETWGGMLCWDYRNSADMILRYVDAKSFPVTPQWSAATWWDIRSLCTKAAKA